MRSRWVFAALLTVSLAGCAPRSPRLEYLPPTGPPAAARAAFVQQPSWLVWGNVVDHIQRQGVRLSRLDEPAGELVAEYSGDPEPYVDCGWIVTYRKTELGRVPAAQSDSSFRRTRNGRLVVLDRDLRLTARLKVEVEPQQQHAFVRAGSTYVLTKMISSERPERPLHTETISFHTGETAAFGSGTTCQPNGKLERLVFDAVPAVSVAGS